MVKKGTGVPYNKSTITRKNEYCPNHISRFHKIYQQPIDKSLLGYFPRQNHWQCTGQR